MRSAKNPTALSAATASITATTSKRNSPARKSRAIWRVASSHNEGGRGAGKAGVFMPRTYTTRQLAADPGVLPRPALNAVCKWLERRGHCTVL